MLYTITQESPIDKVNKHDTIDTAELNSCFFDKTNIKTVNGDGIVIRYDFKTVIDENNNEILELLAINENNNKQYSIVIEDVQTFFDDVASVVYEQKLPDMAETSITLKNKLISKIVEDALKEEHMIVYNTEIKGFGQILSEDNLVGTFESFLINSSNEMTIKTFQSIVKLSDIENIQFKFYAYKQFVLSIELDGSISEESNETGKFKIKKIDILDEEVPNEIKNLKETSEFDSEEDLLLNRRKLIKIQKEEMFDDEEFNEFF